MLMVREPTDEDLDDLAETMRAIDVRECRIIGGLEPREALQECVDVSTWAFAVRNEDGDMVMLFGLSPAGFISDEACPWMLCADGVERHGRDILELTPAYHERMRAECERLFNIVHAHNRSAIRYLKWCGFKFGETIQVKGEPFIPFEWTRGAA